VKILCFKLSKKPYWHIHSTFPNIVNPVNIKLMSSPLVHLSVVPSICRSTLTGSKETDFLHSSNRDTVRNRERGVKKKYLWFRFQIVKKLGSVGRK
jgi:hypothetical protein